jgi:hypothetical protein
VKPFLTDEELSLVIAFTTHRIASTKKNYCHEVNDSWQDVEEAYGFKVSCYANNKKATIYVSDFNNFLHCRLESTNRYNCVSTLSDRP